MSRALALVLAIVAVTPLPALAQKEPRRPKLPASADSNSASAYHEFGLNNLRSRPDEALAAFHWAARMEPGWAEPLYAKRVAYHLSAPHRLADYLLRRGYYRSKEVRAIDSLQNEALLRNPLLYRAHDMLLLYKWYERKGSTIRLTFERHRSDGSRTSVVRDIKREKVGESTAVPASFMLDGETGYVLVTTFVGDKVNEDLRKAIDQLERAGMQRLVLDLRNNGGGSVKEAADVAGLFLPSGAVVHVQEGRKAELNETVKVSRSFFRRERTYPIVLLQNENSASAAELVAGALQDHDRALIVGQPSFGKSLMMRAVALPDGSIMWLVMGHSKTPCGRIIQRQYRGITTREYYRRAAAERDTVGRPSCRTTKGRTVYGGGGIYPDVRLAQRPDAPSWLTRLAEQSVALRWVPGWLESGGASLASLDELARSLALPAGAVADFRAFAARDGAAIPDGADADALLSRWLLPIVADAKWGDGGYYRIHALLDADVREGIAAFSQAAAILGR